MFLSGALQNVRPSSLSRERPIFSFGVIADVQYGDKESKASGSRPQSIMNYRKGVKKLKNAVQYWSEKKKELSFVLNLGDIVDGNDTEEQTLDDFQAAMAPFNQLREMLHVYHVIGNHCLRVPRNILHQALELKQSYYSVKVAEKWRLVVLDTNEIGFKAVDEVHIRESKQFFKEYPPEKTPSVKHWNGGISQGQQKWFRAELEKSKALGEMVIVACHHPVGDGSARETHMAWNHSQIQSSILQSGVVALVLSGHDHPGGYNHLQNTHFLTLHSVVEAPEDEDAFAVIEVYSEGIMLVGFGSAQTIWMPQFLTQNIEN